MVGPGDATRREGGGVADVLGPAAPLELTLHVVDPDVTRELLAREEGVPREQFALAALRVGVLSLRVAQGRIDADTIRAEGDRVLDRLGRALDGHRETVTGVIARSLQDYFDPASGRFNERVDRLIRKDGELEQVLRRQLASEGSDLSRTLDAAVGSQSPIMRQLDPANSQGILSTLGKSVEQILESQKAEILRQFSLDNKDGALARLVLEITGKQEVLGKDLKGNLDAVAAEFSLDSDTSALARMKRELMGVIEKQGKEATEFQEKVAQALKVLEKQKQIEERTTLHGAAFEDALFEFVQARCTGAGAGDLAERTGTTPGLIKNSKVGDVVVTMGSESAAPGARIVVEAKESGGYSLKSALDEIETARKNRGAGVGLFVFSAKTVPAGTPKFLRHGSDVVVVWDREDPQGIVVLEAGLSVARALCLRASDKPASKDVDFEGIERARLAIEKTLTGLQEIDGHAQSVQGLGVKIQERVRILQTEVRRQVDRLAALIEPLRGAPGGQAVPGAPGAEG